MNQPTIRFRDTRRRAFLAQRVLLLLAVSCVLRPAAAQTAAPIPIITPAQAERLIGAPRITLQAQDTPLQEVLDQINQQSGLALQFDMRYWPVDPKRLISFEVRDVPLWDAVLALENQSRGQVVLIENGVALHGARRGGGGAPQSILNPLYSLYPGNIGYSVQSSLTYATGEITNWQDFALYGMLVVDPRLRYISVANAHIAQIVDDKGGSLMPEVKAFEGTAAMGNALFFKLNLQRRAKMGSRIASLKGVISTLIATKTETWEITDARNAAGQSKTVHTNLGDVTYSLADVTRLSQTLRFTFAVSDPRLAGIRGQSAPIFSNASGVYNAAGKAIKLGDGSMSMDFDLKHPDGVPDKFVLTLPVEIKNLEIPFELKDLPLPPAEPTPLKTAAVIAPDPRDAVPALSIEEALLKLDRTRLVTLQFKAASAAEVVAELARQSGVPVAFSQDPERRGPIPTISINVEQQPFWAALRAVIAACKLRFAYAVQGDSIALVSDPQGTLAAAQWQGAADALGLARFTAISSHRNSSSGTTFSTNDGRATHLLRLICEVALDPRLSGMPNSDRMRVDEALDENGDSLRLGPEVEEAYRSSDTAALKFQRTITLQPKAGSRRIAHLKGALRLDAATRTESWEITDFLKEPPLTRTIKVQHGAKSYEQTYTLSDFAITGDEFEFIMRLSHQPPDAMTANDTRAMWWWFRSHAHLSDTGGQLFPIVDIRVMESGPDPHMIVRFPRRIHAHNLAAPAKLVLDLPTEIQRLEIPFEFKDLALP